MTRYIFDIMKMIFILILKIAIVHTLTCEEVVELPSETKITLDNLQSMQLKDIVDCLVHLGKESLPEAESKFIWKSIIKYYEAIENIPDKIFSQLHWITVAVAPEEYSNITLNDIDVIQNFGLNYHLNQAQLSAIASRVLEDFAGKEPEDYTYYDLTALRQILCAFNKTDIERIQPSVYREAALLIGNLEDCNPEAMQGFATLAVQKKAFGSPDGWSEATVKILGKVADFLPT